jgi:iron(III) transport system permease protein
MGERLVRTAATGVAALCLLPLAAVILAAMQGTGSSWASLAATVLPGYALTTLALAAMVAAGTAAIGTGAAWLVTVCRFPGSRILEVALALPLAFPAYVLAYAYTDFLDHPGPVQTALRAVTGWGPRDYWFPEVRSLPGAAAMLVLVLYPYVYLLARAAFLAQSFGGFTAARVLGQSPWAAFRRVSLPLARPAIAGGVILAVMETIADYGTVAHFGVQTFATGIYQAWFSMGDRVAAAELSLCLLGVALLLAMLERIQQGKARRHPTRTSAAPMPRLALRGPAAWAATLACAIPVIFGFAVPVLVLGEMALTAGSERSLASHLEFAGNSLLLAAIVAGLTLLGALAIGLSARLGRDRAGLALRQVSGLGYAVPGGVIAVGLLVPFGALDNLIDALMGRVFGLSTGLLLTGSIALIVMACMARFMAAALNAFDAGAAAVNPSVDAAARTLGRGPFGMVAAVHLPLMRTSLLTGLLLVFVETMKELPATLILRPFNFDTLAVQAHRLASDERLSQAALPSLIIMAFGLLPVVLLCRRMTAGGTQSAAQPA